MFRGNAAVIVLPLLLMGFIFFGGYYYLNSSNQVTNEELNNVISFNVEATSTGSSHTITGNWDWKEMPVDGMLGNDYIGIKLGDEEKIDPNSITHAQLVLTHGDNSIFETEGTVVEDGIIFTFPNELQEHMSYGNIGAFEMVIEGNEYIGTDVAVSYLHTWHNHKELSFDQARLATATIDIDHWVIERFTIIPQP